MIKQKIENRQQQKSIQHSHKHKYWEQLIQSQQQIQQPENRNHKYLKFFSFISKSIPALKQKLQHQIQAKKKNFKSLYLYPKLDKFLSFGSNSIPLIKRKLQRKNLRNIQKQLNQEQNNIQQKGIILNDTYKQALKYKKKNDQKKENHFQDKVVSENKNFDQRVKKNHNEVQKQQFKNNYNKKQFKDNQIQNLQLQKEQQSKNNNFQSINVNQQEQSEFDISQYQEMRDLKFPVKKRKAQLCKKVIMFFYNFKDLIFQRQSQIYKQYLQKKNKKFIEYYYKIQDNRLENYVINQNQEEVQEEEEQNKQQLNKKSQNKQNSQKIQDYSIENKSKIDLEYSQSGVSPTEKNSINQTLKVGHSVTEKGENYQQSQKINQQQKQLKQQNFKRNIISDQTFKDFEKELYQQPNKNIEKELSQSSQISKPNYQKQQAINTLKHQGNFYPTQFIVNTQQMYKQKKQIKSKLKQVNDQILKLKKQSFPFQLELSKSKNRPLNIKNKQLHCQQQNKHQKVKDKKTYIKQNNNQDAVNFIRKLRLQKKKRQLKAINSFQQIDRNIWEHVQEITKQNNIMYQLNQQLKRAKLIERMQIHQKQKRANKQKVKVQQFNQISRNFIRNLIYSEGNGSASEQLKKQMQIYINMTPELTKKKNYFYKMRNISESYQISRQIKLKRNAITDISKFQKQIKKGRQIQDYNNLYLQYLKNK